MSIINDIAHSLSTDDISRSVATLDAISDSNEDTVVDQTSNATSVAFTVEQGAFCSTHESRSRLLVECS